MTGATISHGCPKWSKYAMTHTHKQVSQWKKRKTHYSLEESLLPIRFWVSCQGFKIQVVKPCKCTTSFVDTTVDLMWSLITIGGWDWLNYSHFPGCGDHLEWCWPCRCTAHYVLKISLKSIQGGYKIFCQHYKQKGSSGIGQNSSRW